jgi:CubicO group peptidase (beta-lactamase class C family)
MTRSLLSDLALLAVLAAVAWFLGVRLFRVGRELVRLIRDDREFARLTDTRDLAARTDRLAAEYVARRPHARLVVGVLQRERQLVRGYGRAGPAVPDGKLLYEIGSVTKVLAGVVLAALEAEGVVRLDDQIAGLLPADVVVPDAVGAITLRQLATHTAGLPRLPANLDATVKDEANPYANYTAPDLYAAVRTVRLAGTPGKKSDYSNFGMGLLGHLLALKAGASFDALVRRVVCEPLGMADTVVTPSPEQQARLMPGHTTRGRPTPGWDFDALAAAGALRSTADDLLAFLRANLGGADGVLGPALARAREVHFRTWLGSNQGLGWGVDQDDSTQMTVHWHNGGTGGSVSFVAFEASHRVGVVLLANSGDAMAGDDALDRLGLRLLRTATKVSLAEG